MLDIKLTAKDLSISYRKFKVSGISFELNSGDILGLVGRSGSGKSTIIKSLAGLKKPRQGTLKATKDGKYASIQKLIGYSPQENSLYPFLTLEENLRTFGKLSKLPIRDIEDRQKKLLKRLDLDKFTDKRINKFSGGMQKRADLAVTLIHNPKIIILDEPFNGLDVSLQGFIWDLLKELASEGRIVIVSSHMLADIQKHCNKFGLVEKGKYYDTEQIVSTLKSRRQDLQAYLSKLFMHDLYQEAK